MAETKMGRAWVVRWTSNDPTEELNLVAFIDEKQAVREAAHSAYRLAKQVLEEIDDDSENLKETIASFERGLFQEAYDAWTAYADDVSVSQTVILTEVPLVR